MKGTEHFTRTIAEYLNQRAMTDPLFAPNLQKPNKSIEECITYILSEVQKSGCNGFDDDEIYSMAFLHLAQNIGYTLFYALVGLLQVGGKQGVCHSTLIEIFGYCPCEMFCSFHSRTCIDVVNTWGFLLFG